MSKLLHHNHCFMLLEFYISPIFFKPYKIPLKCHRLHFQVLREVEELARSTHRSVNSAGNRDCGIAISAVNVDEHGRLDAPKDNSVIVLKIHRDFGKLLIYIRSPFRTDNRRG
ncbi:hypothetical protein RHSIM_Rhsim12G0200400 [Rhododendron simsii]|uniref:Uncharacterized protein n=1 Tax=Rhododendron simsii TaxID=118357 RepID=A0A834L801_RHOSS|nr:hypothetical protein RHSIM_Rhsim12G0200400 [Rhododendron simsii]